MSQCDPELNKIQMILVMPCETVVFICKKYRIIRKVYHLCSYEVAILNEDVILKQDSLCDYHPLDEYTVDFEGLPRKFVRLKYLLI